MPDATRPPVEWRSLPKEAAMLAMDVAWGLPIIALLVLVLFGGSQIPKLAKGLGSASREFKKGLEGDDEKSDRPTTD
jgi:TatA/E family protein of Tat protein translocase